jgi:hypothetical protein
VRRASTGSRPVSTGGGYVNFQLVQDDTASTADGYGKNFERLSFRQCCLRSGHLSGSTAMSQLAVDCENGRNASGNGILGGAN